MPALPIGRMGRLAARAFDTLGWHWWPVDAAINSVAHAGRPACSNAGPCLLGCPIRAKSSTDLTYWPRALRGGVELRTRCVAQRIVVTGGRAAGVVYRDDSGAEREQPAEVVVVAANGIGTARLLLASGIGGDAAGRYLMFHPVAYARGMFRAELDGPAGPVGACIYSHELYEDHRIQLQVTRENSLLAQALRLGPVWGAKAHRLVREEFRRSLPVMVVVEDDPDAANRVTISDHPGADGLPAVRVEYALASAARRALDLGLDKAEELLRVAGAHRVSRTALAPLTGWHLLGTARMGTDPRTSVTDAWGRCHDAPNVLVADGSLFPTVGAVNPGATIGALALRIADGLAERMA
jgi:choline dehydrogenase-like flavoprotein